jgi:hypothetical protein
VSHPRDAEIAEIREAILEEAPGCDPAWAQQRAEILYAIALDYEAPKLELIRWIHQNALRNGDYSTGAWIKHCLSYSQFRKRYCTRQESLLPPGYPD